MARLVRWHSDGDAGHETSVYLGPVSIAVEFVPGYGGTWGRTVRAMLSVGPFVVSTCLRIARMREKS